MLMLALILSHTRVGVGTLPLIVSVTLLVPVPHALVAETVMEPEKVERTLPLITPVLVFTLRPLGNPVAL